MPLLIYIYICGKTHTDQAYCKYAFVLCPEHQNPDVQIHPFLGSTFVNVGFKVAVHQATGTMTAFQLEHLHGTTFACSAVNTTMIENSVILFLTFRKKIDNAEPEELSEYYSQVCFILTTFSMFSSNRNPPAPDWCQQCM